MTVRPRVLIVGGDETGAYLARRLRRNWDVVVVDLRENVLLSTLMDGSFESLQGDGTSSLVLRRAGADTAHALVAVTGTDEVNIEIIRQAKQDFGIDNLYAIRQSRGSEELYREYGVEAVDRSQACSAVLAARIERRKVATSIGLGEGEIMEVEVLANSSVIGHRLADLRPRSWLVGAVYREGDLIVPHGDTVIQKGDRVVVIGDPAILSSIATHIGSGESEFPLHYGSNIVALGNRDNLGLLKEIRYLLKSTAAREFEIIVSHSSEVEPAVLERCDELGLAPIISKDATDGALVLAKEFTHGDVGLLVLPPADLSLACRAGLKRSPLMKLIDHLKSPVLIGRGTFPYQTILLVLAELPFDLRAAQLAIDLARIVEGELHLAVVHQPELVVGSRMREEMEETRRQVENLAGMYHVEVNAEALEGNPIRTVVQRSQAAGVLVLPYRRRRKSFLTRPDVGQNLIHRARCSTLVMPTP